MHCLLWFGWRTITSGWFLGSRRSAPWISFSMLSIVTILSWKRGSSTLSKFIDENPDWPRPTEVWIHGDETINKWMELRIRLIQQTYLHHIVATMPQCLCVLAISSEPASNTWISAYIWVCHTRMIMSIKCPHKIWERLSSVLPYIAKLLTITWEYITWVLLKMSLHWKITVEYHVV